MMCKGKRSNLFWAVVALASVTVGLLGWIIHLQLPESAHGLSALMGMFSGMGAGFTLALSLMALIREVFGNGTFFGMPVPVLSDNHMSILTMAPGGFFVFGLLIAAVNKFSAHKPKKKNFGCTDCPSASVCPQACGSGEEEAHD